MWKNVKVFIWRLIFTPYYRIRYLFTYAERRHLQILNSEKTLLYIIRNDCSVSRFGDGEFQMITHYLQNGTIDDFHVDTFQDYSPRLAERLLDVLESDCNDLMVCIPYAFRNSSVYKGYGRTFFEREWLLRKKFVVSAAGRRLFGDSCFTRFYLGRMDIKDKVHYVALLRQIWNGKDVLVVEGEQSRLGVGNELFSNASSVVRILCPATNAFSKYDRILESVTVSAKGRLVLLALGHTATVLAFDLSKAGFHAIDLGHIDIEYEWMRMGAKEKVPVPDKYVNEVSGGRISTGLQDSAYLSQIIDRVL